MGIVTLTLRSEAPLVMHNQRMADPLEPLVKELAKITGKRKKTDEDHAEIQRIEFEGGLYFDSEIGPFVPGEAVHACVREAAKLIRLGREIDRSVTFMDEIVSLHYDGPRTVSELYAHDEHRYRKSVGIGTKRTMRTRPRFNEWTLTTQALIDTSRLNVADFQRICDDAGRYVGLLERRPMFGRFTAIVETEEASANGRG